MKIDPKFIKSINKVQPKKNTSAEDINSETKTTQSKGINISPQGLMVNNLLKTMKASDTNRADKIEDIKNQIMSGEYAVQYEELAQIMAELLS